MAFCGIGWLNKTLKVTPLFSTVSGWQESFHRIFIRKRFFMKNKRKKVFISTIQRWIINWYHNRGYRVKIAFCLRRIANWKVGSLVFSTIVTYENFHNQFEETFKSSSLLHICQQMPQTTRGKPFCVYISTWNKNFVCTGDLIVMTPIWVVKLSSTAVTRLPF